MQVFVVLTTVVVTICIFPLALFYFQNDSFPSFSDCIAEYYEIQRFITKQFSWQHQDFKQSWEKAEAIFISEVEQMKIDFPNEERETWTQLKATIQQTLNRMEPIHPAIITVLLPPSMDMKYGVRFLNQIGSIVNKAVAPEMGYHKVSGEVSKPMVITPQSFEGRSITEIRKDIEIYFQSVGKSLLVLDVDKFEKEEELLLFHEICDNYHAVDTRATITFLVQVPQQIFGKFEWRHSQASHIAHEVYTHAWTNMVNSNVGSALMQRITDAVILLNGGNNNCTQANSTKNEDNFDFRDETNNCQRYGVLLKETLVEIEDIKESISQLANLPSKLDKIAGKINKDLANLQHLPDHPKESDGHAKQNVRIEDSDSKNAGDTQSIDIPITNDLNSVDQDAKSNVFVNNSKLEVEDTPIQNVHKQPIKFVNELNSTTKDRISIPKTRKQSSFLPTGNALPLSNSSGKIFRTKPIKSTSSPSTNAEKMPILKPTHKKSPASKSANNASKEKSGKSKTTPTRKTSSKVKVDHNTNDSPKNSEKAPIRQKHVQTVSAQKTNSNQKSEKLLLPTKPNRTPTKSKSATTQTLKPKRKLKPIEGKPSLNLIKKSNKTLKNSPYSEA